MKRLTARLKTPAKSGGLFIRSVALLCLLAQSFAVPAQFISHPDVGQQNIAATAECPTHSTTAEHAAEPENCDCAGGACCDGLVKRLQFALTTTSENFYPDLFGAIQVTARAHTLFSQTLFFALSRAPPLHANA